MSSDEQKIIYEEDVEAAVEKAIQILGTQGRMLLSASHVTLNAVVESPALGKIWYGDLDLKEDNEKLERLSLELETLLVVNSDDIESRRPNTEREYVLTAQSAYQHGATVKNRYLSV
jgi:hypothetical protein